MIIMCGAYIKLVCVFVCVIGDNWGVTLRGDKEDYIHAVFINVRL